MSRIQVAAVLWRKMKDANFDTLSGLSRGQYDIRLGRDDLVEKFFDGIVQHNKTAIGGYELNVPVSAYTGENPVPATQLKVRFMGAGSERRDWNIPSQRPDTAYPLWRLSRGKRDRAAENYVVLVRDIAGNFHARWLDGPALLALPPHL